MSDADDNTARDAEEPDPPQSSHGAHRAQAIVTPSNRRSAIVRRLGDVLRYEPDPLARPLVDEEFEELAWPARIGEVLRYNLACLEYAIAGNGWLRAYLWLNLRLLLFVLIPITAVLIILSFTTPVFSAIADIFGFIEASSKSLLMATVYLLITLVIVSGVFAAIVALLRRK